MGYGLHIFWREYGDKRFIDVAVLNDGKQIVGYRIGFSKEYLLQASRIGDYQGGVAKERITHVRYGKRKGLRKADSRSYKTVRNLLRRIKAFLPTEAIYFLGDNIAILLSNIEMFLVKHKSQDDVFNHQRLLEYDLGLRNESMESNYLKPLAELRAEYGKE